MYNNASNVSWISNFGNKYTYIYMFAFCAMFSDDPVNYFRHS